MKWTYVELMKVTINWDFLIEWRMIRLSDMRENSTLDFQKAAKNPELKVIIQIIE